MNIFYLFIILIFLCAWWISNRIRRKKKSSNSKNQLNTFNGQNTDINLSKEKDGFSQERITRIILKEGKIAEKYYINKEGKEVRLRKIFNQ